MQNASVAGKEKIVEDPAPDARRELLKRVVSSPTFLKANRLRELLVFLCDRAIADPAVVIREQDVARNVFGRPLDSAAGQDTLVRTHVYQLRKKLQQYFATEGHDEALVIEIPKGAYTPAFSSRAPETGEMPLPETVPLPAPRRVSRLTLFFAVLAAAGALSTLALAVRGAPARSASLGPEFGPAVDRLWSQMFANGRSTSVVLADSDLALFSRLVGRTLNLHEYKSKDFRRLADELVPDPEKRELAKMIMGWYDTGAVEASLAARFGALNAIHHIPAQTVSARDFEMSHLPWQNVVLLGGMVSNPWVELFRGRLKFFAPSHPNWGYDGYCRVAFLPNLSGNGNALLIAGTEEASIAAGGDLVTSERRIRELRAALRVGDADRMPYFEALLKVQVLASSAPEFEIVSHRVIH